MKIIYFDHNSTAPLLEIVKTEMIALMDIPYNPSSLHSYGRRAKYIVEEARRNIFNILQIDSNKYDIVFTASGTEANNLIVNNYKDGTIITSHIEHLSVLKCLDLCRNTIFINLLEDGIVDLNHLEDILKTVKIPKSTLVSVMYANNETGIIQPIKEIADLCHKYSIKFHTDAVQAIGKIDLDLKEIDVDFMTIAGHKFGGPIGASFLLYKKDTALTPHIQGGGQEKNLRSGTENLIAIKGLEKSLEFTIKNLTFNIQKMKYLRDKLEKEIMESSPNVEIIGKNVDRLPNTSNIIMKGISSEKQLIEFDLNNIAVSSGSSCSSGKIGKSHVLKAMKINEDSIACSIRISLGSLNEEAEVRRFVEVWNDINRGNIYE